ncbi:ABC transporter ATP-binding protein [Sanguibacter sp. A247]|uniref:ABC transporter ATP-binding protein n=1 Tax=unclassified Sanguibacter TaxID=2645534 RepID=UPI003FD7C722
MTEVLALHDVSVRRSTTMILDRISWTVQDQDRWVVLGRNGAGKTTLVQVASARMHPSSGTVDILGARLGRVDVSELRPRIGLTSAALADNISAVEMVEDVVLTAAYGMTGRWRERYDEVDHGRATDLLRLFGLSGFERRTFGTLSEGERKRVQIARSLMADPELLLLDEPTAGLDLGGREELVAALSEIAGDRRSPVLVLVTHHVEEIPPNFTHALLLREGKAFLAGPVDQVITSENLSDAFGLPLVVTRDGARFSARGR